MYGDNIEEADFKRLIGRVSRGDDLAAFYACCNAISASTPLEHFSICIVTFILRICTLSPIASIFPFYYQSFSSKNLIYGTSRYEFQCFLCLAVTFICDHPDIRAISFVGSDQAVCLILSTFYMLCFSYMVNIMFITWVTIEKSSLIIQMTSADDTNHHFCFRSQLFQNNVAHHPPHNVAHHPPRVEPVFCLPASVHTSLTISIISHDGLPPNE